MTQIEWKTIAEDSVKKAKTQRRRQKIPFLSVMTQLDVDVLWLGVTRKQPGSQGMNSFHCCAAQSLCCYPSLQRNSS